ncbi:hypothetical protein M3226_22275 [Neobacillus cucumis]|uniref:hypothetical protein n=1 Tax=Neobacillus cucumis TaxID=1740721 RepID=UPI0020413E9A|nr:hypothetical protein [Neobacillus cucumis]MCM3728379.1 hypothetical protein [Neobacillus cucumis]
MIDKKKVFSLAQLIIPWLTVPLMGKRSFFRFLPVASLVNLCLSATSVIANKKQWWINKNPISPGPIDFTYFLGPYFVGTLWIFKLTYGNFSKYLVTNVVIDWINAFPYFFISQKVGLFKFKKWSNRTWGFMSLVWAILIYGIQYLVEQSIKQYNSDN